MLHSEVSLSPIMHTITEVRVDELSFKAAAAVMPETDRTRLHVSIVSSNRRDSVNRLFFLPIRAAVK